MIYSLINYFPENNDKDLNSSALIQFKKGRSGYVREWIRHTMDYAYKNIQGDYDYMIRALHSFETEASGNQALDYLCYSFSYNSGIRYLRSFLKKNNKTKSIKSINNYIDRKEILKNSYFINDNDLDLSNKRILFIDDLYTTGATYDTISDLLDKTYRNCKVDALVLGKTVHNHSELINKDSLHFNIWDYTREDNPKYSSKYPHFQDLGFLCKQHNIFPQFWSVEQIATRDDQIVLKIILLESKEFFLIWLGNFIDLFDNTEIFVHEDTGAFINSDDHLIGVEKGQIYYIKKNYSDLKKEQEFGNIK
jgi:hypoxanthine phosphoribosyltransferase